jgi:uncharacterized protein
MLPRIADKRGVALYLACVFTLTYAWDVGLYVFRNAAPFIFPIGVAVSMLFPALGALAVSRLAPPAADEEVPRLSSSLKLGPWRYYLHVFWIVPVLYAVTYAVTWLTGVGKLDLTGRGYVMSLAKVMGFTASTPGMKVLSNPIFLPVVLAASILTAPFLNSLVALGEELGWRGFLWPRLAPMGFWRATVASGVIWGLWHALVVVMFGFNYPDHRLLGVIWMCGLTTVLGTWMNWLTQKTGSVIIASWVHGVFNSQAYGMWRLITFPVDTLFGGITGGIGFAVLAIPTAYLALTGKIRDLEAPPA